MANRALVLIAVVAFAAVASVPTAAASCTTDDDCSGAQVCQASPSPAQVSESGSGLEYTLFPLAGSTTFCDAVAKCHSEGMRMVAPTTLAQQLEVHNLCIQYDAGGHDCGFTGLFCPALNNALCQNPAEWFFVDGTPYLDVVNAGQFGPTQSAGQAIGNGPTNEHHMHYWHNAGTYGTWGVAARDHPWYTNALCERSVDGTPLPQYSGPDLGCGSGTGSNVGAVPTPDSVCVDPENYVAPPCDASGIRYIPTVGKFVSQTPNGPVILVDSDSVSWYEADGSGLQCASS